MGYAQDVPGLDDQAPPGPDKSGGGQGTVLGEREVLNWAVEVRDSGNDNCPLWR